jgi:hypothetical protein
MRTEILRLMPLLAAMAMAGCTSHENLGEAAAASPVYGGDFRNGSYRASERAALRVRRDEARNRLWMLTPEGVRVYHAATKQLVRAIELPGWSTARIACHPDLALDGRGSAIVSSNAQPTLWRIDGGDFTVTLQDIRLHEREQWDVGFGALAYATDGTLLASTHEGGTLWRVDLEKSSAHIVLARGIRTCSLAIAQ